MATTAPQSPPQKQAPKPGFFERVRDTQVWKSIFRHGYPDTQRNRAMAVLEQRLPAPPPGARAHERHPRSRSRGAWAG